MQPHSYCAHCWRAEVAVSGFILHLSKIGISAYGGRCVVDRDVEPTNEPYAIAKIAGIKLCESYNRQYGRDYRSVMPTNLYGPNDNYHSENSHVIPALLRRFHEAVESGTHEVVVWGSGKPMREFLHVDDMAAASVQIMELSEETYRAHTSSLVSHINVGSGVD